MKKLILLLFTTVGFSQSGIVSGYVSDGFSSFTIGANVVELIVPYNNKFTKGSAKPKPRAKTRGKYKKSEAQKLKEALRRLTLKRN